MIIDLSVLDTTPGATGPHALLAPPAGFTGSEDDYREWIRGRYFNDLQVTQVMYIVAKKVTGNASYGYRVTFNGPYAEVLERIVNKIGRDMRSKALNPQPA